MTSQKVRCQKRNVSFILSNQLRPYSKCSLFHRGTNYYYIVITNLLSYIAIKTRSGVVSAWSRAGYSTNLLTSNSMPTFSVLSFFLSFFFFLFFYFFFWKPMAPLDHFRPEFLKPLIITLLRWIKIELVPLGGKFPCQIR